MGLEYGGVHLGKYLGSPDVDGEWWIDMAVRRIVLEHEMHGLAGRGWSSAIAFGFLLLLAWVRTTIAFCLLIEMEMVTSEGIETEIDIRCNICLFNYTIQF